MSSLSEKLIALSEPHQPSTIVKWLDSLSEEDRKQVWAALNNPEYKTHTLLNIFKDEGGKFGKESFVKFRTGVLDGSVKESDFSVSE